MEGRAFPGANANTVNGSYSMHFLKILETIFEQYAFHRQANTRPISRPPSG